MSNDDMTIVIVSITTGVLVKRKLWFAEVTQDGITRYYELPCAMPMSLWDDIKETSDKVQAEGVCITEQYYQATLKRYRYPFA